MSQKMSSTGELFDEKKELKVNVPEVVRRLWPALRPYRGKFALGVLLILLSTGVEVVNPIVIGRAVDAASGGMQAYTHLMSLCLMYLTLILLRTVLETGQAFVIQSTGQSVTHDLRSLLFEKIERLPVAYFDRNPTGRLLTRVVNDIKALSELFTASISVLVLDFMIIVGTIVAMFFVHARLACFILLVFPTVILTIRYFGHKLAIAYRLVRLRLAEINSFLGENVGAIATIQRLGAETERMERFSRIVDSHNEAQLQTTGVYAMLQPIINTINGLAMGVLIVVGGYWVIHGKMSLGILVAFFEYLRNLFQPVRDMVEKYNTFLAAMVSAERVVGILDEKTEVDGPQPVTPSLPPGPAAIRFEGVSFRYPLRKVNALEAVSFTVEAGTSAAVVGATGSGKSTLIRLLLRFYEPIEGEISLAGIPLTRWNRADLRRHIGVVHQEIYLFQGTIRENLTLGQEGYSDSFLQEQCERAQLWPFIRHRGGLDMSVLEGGAGFSVGERQLLSFARILVANPPVLVLDEATSSVDRLLEKRLMNAIRETLSGRTSIVIAHRLSTIRRCDKVLVLEKARVAEEGTHDGLLKLNGLFANFHEIHSRS